MEKKTAKLILEDGTSFQGYSFGADVSISGEVVFNTGMVGYPEALTDPSYRGQILILTYPLIGNYGIPSEQPDTHGISKHFESSRIQVSGLIIAEYSRDHHHWNSQKSLGDWLKEHQIPAMEGIDTRDLTKRIREKGAMLGKLLLGEEDISFYDPNEDLLVASVSSQKILEYNKGDITIAILDCGIKYNIIRCFLSRGVKVKVLPWDTNLAEVKYDGLFISNGPGNPKMCEKAINNIKKALSKDKPIFGICLGNQLLALAAGADTYKLKYGHRSQNQPVIDPQRGRCYITSQNHGFAVEDKSLPKDWQQWFYNANDNTNEGIRHLYKPFFSVQFHPEAKGGPIDTEYLFDLFLEEVTKRKTLAAIDYGISSGY